MQHATTKQQELSDNRSSSGRELTVKDVGFWNHWTPEMAWALGLMVTDGNISKSSNAIQFSTSDLQLANDFRRVAGILNPISFRKKYKPHHKQAMIVHASCPEWKKSLRNLGVSFNKTYKVEMPPVPAKLFFHFLRGCIDGDGCIFRPANSRRLSMKFTTGSRALAHQLKDVLLDVCPVVALYEVTADKARGYQPNEKAARGHFDMYIHTKHLLPLLDKMYAKSERIRLERKFNVFRGFLAAKLEEPYKPDSVYEVSNLMGMSREKTQNKYNLKVDK